MPRPEFSQPGTQGGGQKVATNHRPDIVTTSITETASVAAGKSEVTEVYAPEGSTYYLKQMRLYAPPPTGSGTGNHTWTVLNSAGFDVTKGSGNYSSGVGFRYSNWNKADDGADPSSEAAQLRAVQSSMATENNPLKLRYRNDTDVSQDQDRTILLIFEEESL